VCVCVSACESYGFVSYGHCHCRIMSFWSLGISVHFTLTTFLYFSFFTLLNDFLVGCMTIFCVVGSRLPSTKNKITHD
jgi:hypothetical protein